MIYRISTDESHRGWSDLAEAIILQAAQDYRHINKQLLEKPTDPILLIQRVKLNAFFLSSWFVVLTDLDGKSLLHRLQSEANKRDGK